MKDNWLMTAIITRPAINSQIHFHCSLRMGNEIELVNCLRGGRPRERFSKSIMKDKWIFDWFGLINCVCWCASRGDKWEWNETAQLGWMNWWVRGGCKPQATSQERRPAERWSGMSFLLFIYGWNESNWMESINEWRDEIEENKESERTQRNGKLREKTNEMNLWMEFVGFSWRQWSGVSEAPPQAGQPSAVSLSSNQSSIQRAWSWERSVELDWLLGCRVAKLFFSFLFCLSLWVKGCCGSQCSAKKRDKLKEKWN